MPIVISHYSDSASDSNDAVSVRVGVESTNGNIHAHEHRMNPAEARKTAAELLLLADEVEMINAGRRQSAKV